MNRFTKIWLIVIGAIFIGIIAYISFQPKLKKELRLATGPIGSDSYAYGLSYQSLLLSEGVDLILVPTKGSLDTIGFLNQKQVDIGFIQSGILPNKSEYNFESLASVYYQPMWIFYRNDGYRYNYLIEATDKNIGISYTNDGNYELAKQILDANGMTPEKTNFVYLYDNEAKEALKNKKIDMFITFTSERSSDVLSLFDEPNVEILSLKRAKAYSQRFNSLKNLSIYEGAIDLYRNIPSEKIDNLSSVQNLVARKGLPDELIRIFLKKVKMIHSGRDFFEGGESFPNLKYLDTAINSEAEVYLTVGDSWLEEIFPFWIATNIDRFKLLIIPILGLLIPLLKSIVPLYVFTIRSKIFRWYKRLSKFDSMIQNSDGSDFKEIENGLISLKNELQEKTKVPLSYMGEYYNLLLHIELLEKKLSDKKSKI